MNGLPVLFCCIAILGAPLCAAENIQLTTADVRNSTDPHDNSSALPYATSASIRTSEAPSLTTTQSTTTVSRCPNSQSTSPGSQPTTTLTGMFFRKECLWAFMVTGGLIIACFILLVSTLLLTWKVCQLSRRIKALSSDADLISTSEYWMGTAKRNKSKSEAEAKETTVLMSDLSQSQEEMGNGTTKEEGGKVNEDGKMGEENKKEVGDSANSAEASTTPAAAAENSSSPKPQEEAPNSQASKAIATSSSEGTEEPKEVV